MQISLLPKVSEYLSLIMTLIFSFGLVFQLPVVTSLMARVGLLTSQGLREKRKWAIVIAFIVAAVLTPPDPLSQISLAIPTILLYEISIWTARLIEKRREEEKIAREKKDAAPTATGESAGSPKLRFYRDCCGRSCAVLAMRFTPTPPRFARHLSPAWRGRGKAVAMPAPFLSLMKGGEVPSEARRSGGLPQTVKL